MPYLFGKYYPLRRIVFFLGEASLIFAAIFLIQTTFMEEDKILFSLELCLLRTGLVTLVFILSLYFFDLYDLDVYSSFSDTATRMTQAFGVGCIALALIYYALPFIIIPTKIFLFGYLLICVFLTVWRFVYIFALRKLIFAEPIVVLGTGELAGNIANEIIDHIDTGYQIAAFIGKSRPTFPVNAIPVYENMDGLRSICRKHDAEIIVMALDDRRGVMPVNELIDCKMEGIRVWTGVSFFEKLTGKIMVEKVNPDWIIYAPGFSISRMNNAIKRSWDLIFSGIGLIIASPIMLISAIIIKLESPGPVFYCQDRVGLRGQVFKVFKFRSMRQDAEKNGAVWAMENDDRVTKFGAFARKVRIDELPQLWNVLRGEMSFVGPRPERPVFVDMLAKKIPYYPLRHNIKPGVTGWAQICYPYGASEEDALRKLEYDLYYLKNLSFSMDMGIVFQTIKTVLLKKGAR